MTSFGFLLVVVVIAAIIIAEFLINSSFQCFSAGKTGFSSRYRHSKDFRQSRYRKLSVCKRFYPFSFTSKRIRTGYRFSPLSSLCCQSVPEKIGRRHRLIEIKIFKHLSAGAFAKANKQNLKLCTL